MSEIGLSDPAINNESICFFNTLIDTEIAYGIFKVNRHKCLHCDAYLCLDSSYLGFTIPAVLNHSSQTFETK